jgi:hypothetical protein
MHHADPDRSIRLSRTLAYLKAHQYTGCTTAEIQAWTGSMAPATDISELRQSGHIIPKPTSTMTNGRRIFRYFYRGKEVK